jgi:hypothetical protein
VGFGAGFATRQSEANFEPADVIEISGDVSVRWKALHIGCEETAHRTTFLRHWLDR